MSRGGHFLTLTGAALSVLLACRPETQSSSPAPRPTEDGLRPMTSRDGAPAGAAPAADPHAAGDPHAGHDHSGGGHGETLPPGHPPVEGAPAGGVSGGPSVSGSVDAAPAVKDKIKGGALYVIARNAKTRQIVAVRKLDQSSIPQAFEISGAHAMTPGTPFEGPLNIIARWSHGGDAMPSPGDVEGIVTDVAVGAKGVKLVLSEVRK